MHFNNQLARALHRILEWRYHNNPWPATTFRVNTLAEHIINRINQASVSLAVDISAGEIRLNKNFSNYLFIQ